nr:hypothetical protein I308_01539 [Cryptococcus tetragattii IND107]
MIKARSITRTNMSHEGQSHPIPSSPAAHSKSCLYKILGWYSLMGSSDHLWWQHRAVQKTLR